MNPTIDIPHFAPQLMEEVSPNLKVVYVLPWRSNSNTSAWFERIQNLCSNNYDAELIIVFHSFEADTDKVISDNLNAYWDIEKLKPILTKKGLVLNTINMIGLNQEWKETALPYLIGMDEALQRLSDAGNLNGIISTLNMDEDYEPNFTQKIIRSYQLKTSMVAAESNWEYKINEETLPTSLLKAAVHHELRSKLNYQRLQKSGFPFPVVGRPVIFSIKGWMFKQIRPMVQNLENPFQQMLHHSALQGGSISQLSDLCVYPICDPFITIELQEWEQIFENESEPEPIIANSTFNDLQQFITFYPNFYHGNTVNDYQTIIRKLPQSIRAFLTDEQFFDRWKEIKSESRNLEQFKRKFYQWLSPDKVNQFLSFCTNHFNRFEKIDKAASNFLMKSHGIRANMMDEEQLLKYFRNPDGKLKVVSSKHRA